MQYQVHLRPQSPENGQKPFSWIINEDYFSQEIRPCQSATITVLYHRAKFRQNPMSGSTRFRVTHTHTHWLLSQVLAQLKLRTATCLKAQISTLVLLSFKPSNLPTIKPLNLTFNKPLEHWLHDTQANSTRWWNINLIRMAKTLIFGSLVPNCDDYA